MEVRKDFAKRVSGIATATPREAVANLLRSMLPREPVRTREPVARGARILLPDGTPFDAPIQRDPLKPLRRVRTRKLRNQSYELTGRRNAARRGTKRWSQLEIVLANTTTRDARLAGAETVDITFAIDEGYIKLID